MKFRVSKKALLPVALIAGALAITGLLYATKAKTPPIQAQEQAWVIATQPVKLETVSPTLPLYGRVETPRTAKLAAAVSAEVREVYVREGNVVRQGQHLIQLDDRDSRYQLQSREADVKDAQAAIDSARKAHASDVTALKHEQALLDLSKKALQRARDLVAKNLSSQSQVDDARQAVERQALAVNTRRLAVQNYPAQLAQLKARLERAKAQKDAAALDLAHTHIDAPFAGTVSQVMVAPGDRVNVNNPLLELYDTSDLELRAQIPAPYVPAVRRMLADGTAAHGSGTTEGQDVSVVLERLSGQVQQGSGGIDGLFRVNTGREHLALGQFVDLSVELAPQPNVVVLPSTALYGMKRIYLLRDGRMAGVEVKLVGERRRNGKTRVLVQSPQLHDGDQAIITHLPNAIDGLHVKTAAES